MISQTFNTWSQILVDHAVLTNTGTSWEGIASESMRARTYWIVVVSSANCFNSTSVGTRILTFLVDTRKLRWTLWINNTFWTTIWWSTNKIWKTWTNSLRVYFTTLWIWTTWWWFTWISARRRRSWFFTTMEERITSVTRWTYASRNVWNNLTNGIASTCSNTRIDAFVFDTG